MYVCVRHQAICVVSFIVTVLRHRKLGGGVLDDRVRCSIRVHKVISDNCVVFWDSLLRSSLVFVVIYNYVWRGKTDTFNKITGDLNCIWVSKHRLISAE